MSPTRVEVLPDAEALAERVARDLLTLLRAAQATGRVPQVALTGGTVADQVHRAVGRLAPGSGVDWARVALWWGDERFVAPDSPDRNAGPARRVLLDVVGADPAKVHEMPSTADAPDVAAGAAAYAATVRADGGGEFDLVLLGMGPDGHVASLFPGRPEVELTDRIAVGVTDSPKPPPERISLTLPALNRAREVWFLVTGAAKADAVSRSLADPARIARDPAQMAARDSPPAARVHGRLGTTWYLDQAAASELG